MLISIDNIMNYPADELENVIAEVMHKIKIEILRKIFHALFNIVYNHILGLMEKKYAYNYTGNRMRKCIPQHCFSI